MGIVYKAEDLKLHRIVALKFLPENFTALGEDIARFEREAEAISSLNHPNIATIHDIDEVEGRKFLTLEFISGGTLKSKVKQLHSEGKEIPIDQVVDYGIQMADGLAHAHQRGIIHRDIKTDNVMLSEGGLLKITDFGLAKLKGGVDLTRAGSTIGTAAYMSPEQLQNQEADQRSDLFSLGVVLYELTAMQVPFRGEHESALIYSIVNENPPPVRSRRSDAPEGFERIIARCLEKDPQKRYQRAEEVAADLRSIQRGNTPSVKPASHSSRLRRVIAAGLVVIAAVLLYFFIPLSHSISANSKTVAVLPFVNMSGDSQDEYFSDGMTEDILTQLAKISDLKVISRTTMMKFKGTTKSLKEIGNELNAGVVLEGSVRRILDQVRITAQLIDASTDEHLWAETYDKEFKQVFAIQSDVARKIAAALEAKLSPAEKERIERKPTTSTDAYNLYLRGRYYWNKRSEEDNRKSIGYFEEAIDKDPTYALAYAGLADAYITNGDWAFLPPKECYPKGKAAATRALQIDSSLGEAQTALAYISYVFDWDWSEAEKRFRLAIALNPNYPTAHQWYAEYLAVRGRLGDARAEITRARDLDPLSLIINGVSGNIYNWARKYDLAVEECKRTVEMDSNFYPAHLYLAWAYEHQGDYDRAFAEYEKVELLSGSTAKQVDAMRKSYALSGMKGYYEERLKILQEKFAQRYIPPHRFAEVYAGVGEKDQAFQWLQKSYEERSYQVFFVMAKPAWATLRSDPRYIAMLRTIHLEQ